MAHAETLSGWSPERSIRSELLRWLCASRAAREYLVEGSQIEVREARLEGRLNLSYLKVPFPMICLGCWFPDGIELFGTEMSDLILNGSWLGTLSTEANMARSYEVFLAEGVHVSGVLSLRDGFHAEGEVNLIGADVEGDLTCSGAHFRNPNRRAVTADRAEIQGNVHLRRKFVAEGAVRLTGAKLYGDPDCSGGTCSNRGGDALLAQGATIDGNVLLRRSSGGSSKRRGAFRLTALKSEVTSIAQAENSPTRSKTSEVFLVRYLRRKNGTTPESP